MDSQVKYCLVVIVIASVACTATAQSYGTCSLPKVVGPCRAVIPRWYYNSQTKLCEEFNYGGCQGNANNFETKEECMRSCVCSLPSATGFCRAAFPKWAYNVKTGRCEQFTWGGCFLGGNGNVFQSDCECYRTCAGVSNPIYSWSYLSRE